MFQNRLTSFCVLPLLATLAACSSTPAQQQGYCDDCLIRKSSQGVDQDSPERLHQRAQRQIRLAKVAEDRKEYQQAYDAWQEALGLVNALRSKHPKHLLTVQLNESDSLGGVTVSSIKTDRLATLSQKMLISSSVLGWARYEMESASRYQQAELMISLAGSYLDLGRWGEARELLERADASLGDSNGRWQRRHVVAMERVMADQKAARWSAQAGRVAACVLAPSACALPGRLSVGALRPQAALMRSNGYPARSYYGVQALIDLKQYDDLLAYAVSLEDVKERQRVIARIIRHASATKDQPLADKAMDMLLSAPAPLGPASQRFELLLNIFGSMAASRETDRGVLLSILDTLQKQIKKSQDASWRVSRLASMSMMLSDFNRAPQAKATARQALAEFQKLPPSARTAPAWSSVAKALIQTGQTEAAQPLLAAHLGASDLATWAGVTRALILQGQTPSLKRLEGLEPSVPHVHTVIAVAQDLFKQGKVAQAKPLSAQARKMIASAPLQSQDLWTRSNLLRQLVVLSVLAQDDAQFGKDLKQLKAFALETLPQNEPYAFDELVKPLTDSLLASIRLKRPAMAKALLKELRDVNTLKSERYFPSKYSRPVFEAYMKAGQWDEALAFLDSLPKYRGSASGSHSLIISMLTHDKGLTPPPAFVQKLQAAVISDLSSQKYYSFYTAVNLCKMTQKKACVQELISVAKDLDKTNTKQNYSSAVRSLSQSLVSYGLDGSLGLLPELKRDYDKASLLTQNLQQWANNPELRRRRPNLPQEVDNLAATLPKEIASNLQGARIHVMAIQDKCAQIPGMFKSTSKDEDTIRYATSDHEVALQLCVIRGDYVPAIQLMERFAPGGRARQLISLGYALEASGAANRPEVKAQLKRIAEELFERGEEGKR